MPLAKPEPLPSAAELAEVEELLEGLDDRDQIKDQIRAKIKANDLKALMRDLDSL